MAGSTFKNLLSGLKVGLLAMAGAQRISLTGIGLQIMLVVPTSSSLISMATQRSHNSGLLRQPASGVQLPTPALLTQKRAQVPCLVPVGYGAWVCCSAPWYLLACITNRLLADLGLDKLKDNCGQKPERLWFGNQKAEFTFNNEVQPVPDLLQDIAYEDEVEFTSTEVTDLDVKRCQWLLRRSYARRRR